MFKLLFIGYLYGVRSERQLMREVQVNVAYRWFARFRLTDKVPDASTFSRNRRPRCIRRSSMRSCARRWATAWWTAGCFIQTART
ncbi:transposase [Paraburkholderia bannensis]|uniref:Transposase n=1 Tax=Paraburkholderia bannensis TaxID=765414 RepID=A0A7W9WTB4_9BURK|nr:transposase [Paraburkholderia sp. WP4_3_2]MBB6103409.1 transposase [Paraburkholderia bannensis]